jgi:hypothetical protein
MAKDKLHKPSGKPGAAAISDQQNKNRLAGFIVVLILAGIPFALGRYFEFNYPDPFDSAAYVYSAEHLLTGAKLGVDEIPSALPGTLLVNMLGVKLFGFSEFGPKLIQTIEQAIALVLMFYTMRKLYGTLAGAVGVIAASVYLGAPLIAKFGNVKEQHMIAFMVIGVCCYVLRQLNGKWWLAILAGAALGWGPMFKQTAVSAIAAVGLFVLIGPLFKWRSLKETASDIGLLAGGFLLGVGPVWAWILANNYAAYLPYNFVWLMLVSSGAKGKLSAYVASARQMYGFSKQWPVVMRYYGCLILPIALSLGAIIVWVFRRIIFLFSKEKKTAASYEHFTVLFGIWWLLDMALIWVSPRSYEQYYLPMTASAGMIGGYLIAIYRDKVVQSNYSAKWIFVGAAGLVCMVIMSWHIFFGIKVSPFSGRTYPQGRSRGYVQRWEEIQQFAMGAKMPWQDVGDYIRQHSTRTDEIYVWGWFPGIYLRADRLSPAPVAFESEMHTRSPEALAGLIDELLKAFNKKVPKFLVDSRKYEFPWDRPELPLWPMLPGPPYTSETKLITGDAAQIAEFDKQYEKLLEQKFGGEAEAKRYMAMKPMRDFVMSHYRIVGMFGEHVLFELKNTSSPK